MENLKSSPCGGSILTPAAPPLLLVLVQMEVFGCPWYSEARADLVITAVSGVALALVLEPEINLSGAGFCSRAAATLMTSQLASD